MKVITVTVRVYGNMALYNIESTDFQTKYFGMVQKNMGFTKGANFSSFDNVDSAKEKIDLVWKATERFTSSRKVASENLDDLINMFLQATVEGKIICRDCGNPLKPGIDRCGRCGWENKLLSEGFM